MSKNKILDEFISNKYDNKEKNYNLIISKINQRAYMKNKILNMVAILFVVIIVGTVGSSIYAKKNWENEYREYQERNTKLSTTIINNEINNGYVENLNMDYIYQEGLGIKIDSLLITDDCYEMKVNFKIIDEQKKEFNTFDFGYAIYDENNNIYDIRQRNKGYYNKNNNNYEKNICNELGIIYKPSKNMPKHLIATQNISQNIIEENIIKTIRLNSFEGFPRSRSIYIRIFDIGYSLTNYEEGTDGILNPIESEDFELYNYEWQFKIDVPEKFYDRTSIKLKLEENIEGFEGEYVSLSDTGLILNLNHKYSLINVTPNTINIIDAEGNEYHSSAGMSDDYIIKQVFSNISKNDLEKGLYLIINIPDYNIYKKVKLIEN